MDIPRTKKRIGIAAGLVAGSAGLALFTSIGPGPSLLPIASAQSSDDSSSTTEATAPTSTTVATTAAPSSPAGATRMVDAAGAGTVTYTVNGGNISLVAATPAAGFRVEVEQSAGREVELDFRRGTQRVQVNLEFEDGAVRERVRIRDEANGTDIRIENGVVVRAEGPNADDNGGADDNSGPGSGTTADDNSGPSASSGPSDDSGSSGHGSDDVTGDDNGGHGADDPAGDDHGSGGHGADDPAGDDHGSGGHGADD
jgi:hypothetical protein